MILGGMEFNQFVLTAFILEAAFGDRPLKGVSATFLLVCFVCLKESTCETRKNAFYFTTKALLVLEIINQLLTF